MLIRGLSVSLAAVLAFGLAAGAADAEQRKKPRRALYEDRYYAGPDFVSRIPGIRVLFGDYALTEDEYNELYGSPDTPDKFDESYYEPQPADGVKPKKKPAVKSVKATPKAPADTTTTASIDNSRKPVEKSTVAAKPAETTPVAKPATVNAAVSCDKANEIIGGYGFAGITAQSCKGKVYAFNATRDGKSFAIKLDSASGELTEVKKLP